MFLFIQNLGSFGFFNGDISVGWSEGFEIIVVISIIFDVLIDFERRDLDILLISFMFVDHSFGSKLLVIPGRNRNILDDGNIQSCLTLCVFVHFRLLQSIFAVFFILIILELFCNSLETDLAVSS